MRDTIISQDTLITLDQVNEALHILEKEHISSMFEMGLNPHESQATECVRQYITQQAERLRLVEGLLADACSRLNDDDCDPELFNYIQAALKAQKEG